VAPRGGRRTALNRGTIYEVPFADGQRPGVILTRDRAIPLLASVTVAGVTRTIRGLPTEVPLDERHGLEGACVINCDNLFTIPKSALGRRRGELDPEARMRLREALMLALELDEP
jgi:mRNA interferase MazF